MKTFPPKSIWKFYKPCFQIFDENITFEEQLKQSDFSFRKKMNPHLKSIYRKIFEMEKAYTFNKCKYIFIDDNLYYFLCMVNDTPIDNLQFNIENGYYIFLVNKEHNNGLNAKLINIHDNGFGYTSCSDVTYNSKFNNNYYSWIDYKENKYDNINNLGVTKFVYNILVYMKMVNSITYGFPPEMSPNTQKMIYMLGGVEPYYLECLDGRITKNIYNAGKKYKFDIKREKDKLIMKPGLITI